MRKQMNRLLSVLLCALMLLSLLPTAAMAAGAAVTVDRVVATAVNVTPAIGKKAVVSVTDVEITVPVDLPVKSRPRPVGTLLALFCRR